MNIEKIISYAKPMDPILLGSGDLLSYLIRYAQKPQTLDGKPSLHSHGMLFWSFDTVIESTMDFTPYPTRKLDNGVQFNYLKNHADAPMAMLMHFPWTDAEREILKREALRLKAEGISYSVSGLLGSLLSYWIFPWASNPLQSKHSLNCSAFIQECCVPMGIDFDPKHTARNTSPEMISQYEMEGLEKIDCSEGK